MKPISITGQLLDEYSRDKAIVEGLLSHSPLTQDEIKKLDTKLREIDSTIRQLEFEKFETNSLELEGKLKLLKAEVAAFKSKAKIVVPNRSSFDVEDETQRRIREKYDQISGLDAVNKNVTDAQMIAGDVAMQLDQDAKRFLENRSTVKLLNTDLNVSTEIMMKIYLKKKKSDLMFYASIAIPVFLILLAIGIRMFFFGKKVFSKEHSI